MAYLLDTNIVSILVRDPHGRLAQRVLARGKDEIVTSIIVAAELRYGAQRRESARLSEQLESVLGSLTVLPLEAPADVEYGRIRSTLERAGQPIGRHDLLIAAHAVALNHIVVTDNVREFARVPGLLVENWLRDPEPA